MSYTTRKDLFEKIETHRSRPLIAYVTSIRPNFSGQMAGGERFKFCVNRKN